MELPRYKCHKEVWALKIKEVSAGVGGIWYLFPEDEVYGPIPVDDDYMQKHSPRSGNYYVVYSDGYVSCSPAKAFEEGYVRV